MQASARSALAASGSERWRSALGVALIHLAIGAALLSGLAVTVVPRTEPVTQLVDVALRPPPPRVKTEPPAPVHHDQGGSAPRAPTLAPAGGSPGPVKRAAAPAPTPPIILNPVATGGGSSGTGEAIGAGSGGGNGGNGSGDGVGDGSGDGAGDGGRDLEQIAGEITRADVPRTIRDAMIGGRVEFRFTVGVDGRVHGCTVTRSSGSAELDQTTCRLVTERFRYRPSTDSRGRPIADEVEGDYTWRRETR